MCCHLTYSKKVKTDYYCWKILEISFHLKEPKLPICYFKKMNKSPVCTAGFVPGTGCRPSCPTICRPGPGHLKADGASPAPTGWNPPLPSSCTQMNTVSTIARRPSRIWSLLPLALPLPSSPGLGSAPLCPGLSPHICRLPAGRQPSLTISPHRRQAPPHITLLSSPHHCLESPCPSITCHPFQMLAS